MDNSFIKKLESRLLDGGLAWKHVKRLLREVNDHHNDLVDMAKQRGLDKKASNEYATEQLGSCEILVEQMLARPELLSLGRRYPKAMMLMGPLVSFILCFITIILVLVLVLSALFPSGLLESNLNQEVITGMKVAAEVFRLSLMHLLAPIIALWTIRYAIRHRVSLTLTGIGVIAMCVLSTATTIFVGFPNESLGIDQGSIGVNLGFNFPSGYELGNNYTRLVLTVLPISLISSVFYLKSLRLRIQ